MRVAPTAARAAEGRPFGNFTFTTQPACSQTAIWFRGTYTRPNGVSGQALACANTAGRLVGRYRDDPVPGAPFLSGSFGLDHVPGNPPRFGGEIVEDLRGSASWSGTCTGGGCLGAAAPGAPSPGLVDLLNGVDPGLPCATAMELPGAHASLETTGQPTFCGFRPLRDDVRAGVEGNAATFAGGALVTCLSTVAGSALVALSAPATGGASAAALPPALQWVGVSCAAAVMGWLGTEARAGWDDVVRERTGAPRFEKSAGGRPKAATSSGARRIVLPRPRLRITSRVACPPGPVGGACRRVDDAGRRAASASGEAASLAEALAATLALGRKAAAAGDIEGAAIQSAVADVYTGAMAPAVVARSRALVGFAAALRGARLERRLSGGQARAAARRISRLHGIPPVVIARLRADGFTRAQIRAGFGRFAEVETRPLTLTATLAATDPVPGLSAAPRSVTVPQVAAIVRALGDQGRLPGPLATTLLGDLAAVQGTTGPAQAAAKARLREHARQAPGRHGLVLQLAVRAVAA